MLCKVHILVFFSKFLLDVIDLYHVEKLTLSVYRVTISEPGNKFGKTMMNLGFVFSKLSTQALNAPSRALRYPALSGRFNSE